MVGCLVPDRLVGPLHVFPLSSLVIPRDFCFLMLHQGPCCAYRKALSLWFPLDWLLMGFRLTEWLMPLLVATAPLLSVVLAGSKVPLVFFSALYRRTLSRSRRRLGGLEVSFYFLGLS